MDSVSTPAINPDSHYPPFRILEKYWKKRRKTDSDTGTGRFPDFHGRALDFSIDGLNRVEWEEEEEELEGVEDGDRVTGIIKISRGIWTPRDSHSPEDGDNGTGKKRRQRGGKKVKNKIEKRLKKEREKEKENGVQVGDDIDGDDHGLPKEKRGEKKTVESPNWKPVKFIKVDMRKFRNSENKNETPEAERKGERDKDKDSEGNGGDKSSKVSTTTMILFPEYPGFLLLPSHIPPPLQRSLVLSSVGTINSPSYRTSLDDHWILPTTTAAAAAPTTTNNRTKNNHEEQEIQDNPNSIVGGKQQTDNEKNNIIQQTKGKDLDLFDLDPESIIPPRPRSPPCDCDCSKLNCNPNSSANDINQVHQTRGGEEENKLRKKDDYIQNDQNVNQNQKSNVGGGRRKIVDFEPITMENYLQPPKLANGDNSICEASNVSNVTRSKPENRDPESGAAKKNGAVIVGGEEEEETSKSGNRFVLDPNTPMMNPITVGEALDRVRWCIIGREYDWTTKSYRFSKPSLPIPSLIDSVCKRIVTKDVDWEFVHRLLSDGRQQPQQRHSAVQSGEAAEGNDDEREEKVRQEEERERVRWKGWNDVEKGYKPEAGIVNFYQLKDSLTSHVDQSEPNAEKPLVSISLGHSAIFLIGDHSRESPRLPLSMLLRSGDVGIMFGAGTGTAGVPKSNEAEGDGKTSWGRRRFHGLPRVIPNSLPNHFTSTSPSDWKMLVEEEEGCGSKLGGREKRSNEEGEGEGENHNSEDEEDEEEEKMSSEVEVNKIERIVRWLEKGFRININVRQMF